MQSNIPEVIIHSKDYIGINYALLTSVLTKAIQELDLKVTPVLDLTTPNNSFVGQLIAWLGNSANGIGDLFARNLHASNQVCVGQTCLSEDQIKSLIQLQSQLQSQQISGGTQTPSAPTTPDVTPPVTGETPPVVSPDPTASDSSTAMPVVTPSDPSGSLVVPTVPPADSITQ